MQHLRLCYVTHDTHTKSFIFGWSPPWKPFSLLYFLLFCNEIPTAISNRALLVRVVCPQNNCFLWTKNSKTVHDNMLQQMLHNCAFLKGKYFFVKFFSNILKIFFLHLAEFSNKDIVQDLNRLLKLGASGNSSTLRKWYYSLMTANCKKSYCGNNTRHQWYVGGPCDLKRKAWDTTSKGHKLSNIQYAVKNFWNF